ncbi:MAG: DUF2062 domain-containing protein [Methylobacter sp.]|nr:DUF2062 domain-containing protein [Methylobacter sp.]
MPKKLIQKLIDKFIPDPEVIKQHKSLQFLGDKLHEPNLWHLNRRSIALAFAVGLFCAWIPTPTQMAFAAMGAIYYRANIPISVALVWVTNPITMPPLYYFAYEVGLSFLNQPTNADESEFSISNIFSSLGDVWQPFLVGCLIMGIISSAAGYFGIQYYWQYHVNKKWAERKEKRLTAQESQIEDIKNELD